MRVGAVGVQSPHDCLKPFAALVPSSVSHSRKGSNPFYAFFKLPNFKETSKIHEIRRSRKSNVDAGFVRGPSFYIQGSSKTCSQGGERNWKREKSPSRPDSFSGPRFDLLEPVMLGIEPEFPDWPDRETAVWATVERKAKSLEIPLSLRMIKKKLQSQESFTGCRGSAHCAVNSAFSSMVFIVAELQGFALQMREALSDEDLELITSKVHKDMHSSFVWLFQQVFCKTPDLMLHVMILLANYTVYSASHGFDAPKIPHSQEENTESTSSNTLLLPQESLSQETSAYPCDEAELNLWDSTLDAASKMSMINEVLDPDITRFLVSPVSVEIEPDEGYEDYFRTDLIYQMNLSVEPNNSLLLCNYAQFLHLVAKDYDRAEECFKRAVQAETTPDAESLSQYANFLWAVRKDFAGAEERFLQALAYEPENSYYASKYAFFLWSTGGEETCFLVNGGSSSVHRDL